MNRTPRPGGHRQIIAQGALTAAALGALFFAPPAAGRMVVVPLLPAAVAAAPGLALGHGATLIGGGPLAGSLVVDGRRDALLWTMLSSGSLLLTATPAGCGTGPAA